ncbi:hypothetical protein ACN28C_22545 [Plantactinospora sp. WMMC1484]|uniref:hypothetical protein n=1 Tax=Plantactinospora sp. WMMC1484 TaxID=3404122 RepID=UPI003BF5A694
MPDVDDPAAVVDVFRRDLETTPTHVRDRLRPVLAGLDHVVAGGDLGPDGAGGPGRRLLGWTVGRHWLDDRSEP